MRKQAIDDGHEAIIKNGQLLVDGQRVDTNSTCSDSTLKQDVCRGCHSISFCIWNINGFSVSKLVDLCNYFTKFDFVCLSETWLKDEISFVIDLPGYVHFSFCRHSTNHRAKSYQ